jgi:hypothetical protein
MIWILALPFLLYIVGATIACFQLHKEPMRELTPEEAALEKEMEENLTVFELVWTENG